MASSIVVLAARRLRRQVKQLTAQLDGLRTADDLEYVHRARVATRRLRAALRVFESHLPPTKLPRWKKALRQVGRGLGDARDKDVQIVYLEDALRGAGGVGQALGVARVLAQWEERREDLQPAVLRAAKRLRASGVLAEIMAFARRRIPSGKNSKKSRKIVLDAKLYRHAQREIVQRIDALRALEDCLVDPGDGRRHHTMRIAAKRLRYTLELFKGVYAGRIDAILESLKQLQTLLGEVHDCDVWLEQLDAFVRKHRRRLEARYEHAGPLVRWMPGIEYLQEDRRQRRRQQFETAVQFWQGLTGAGLWDDLLRIVRTAVEAEASSRAARTEEAAPPTALGEHAASQPAVGEGPQVDVALTDTVSFGRVAGTDRGNGNPAARASETDDSAEADEPGDADPLDPDRPSRERGNGHRRRHGVGDAPPARRRAPRTADPAEVGG